MEAYSVFVLVIFCNIMVGTTGNALSGGSLRSCECIDEVDELTQQLEQTQQRLEQTEQRLEETDHTQQELVRTQQEFKQTVQTFEKTEQRFEQQFLVQERQLRILHKLVTTSLTGRVDNSGLNSLKRSKRGVPSTEEDINVFEEFFRCCGVTGAPGRDGRDGEFGRNGEDGKDGVDGQPGEPGQLGLTGAPGRDGRDGEDGKHGVDGTDGKDGVDSEPGEPGKDGVTGAPGINGSDGESGKNGEDGLNGRDGTDGKDGEDGKDGADGQPGESGKNGVTGAPGRDGRDGEDGQPGEPGKDGKDGLPGLPGVPGPKGAPGSDGATGSQGLRGLRGYAGEDSTAEMEAGAVYTRWGKTTCGSQSTLVYEGFAGNSRWNVPGGGTNYQCLPLRPEYNKFSGNFNNWYGTYMAGVEYESGNYGIFPNSAHSQNVPCARCYSENRAAVMMIPAKRTCPEEWTKEYEGYLMTMAEKYYKATFECVDSSPEYIRGLASNTDGGLFYFVKATCSGQTTGHCPPYSTHNELSCVVCTK